MALTYFGISLVFLLGHLCQSFSLSAPDVSFKAGVVEFKPDQASGSANIYRNLRGLEALAEEANSTGVQILVFPEDAITGYLYSDRGSIYPYLEVLPPTPDEGVSIIPCNNPMYENQFVLQWLSCIALHHQLVLVANMGEKVPCYPSDPYCPADGRYQYNADVVFEKDGRFIAKYRKFNLYGPEKNFWNVPPFPEHITFTTSFGVTFGVFTCFDILFTDPALRLVEKGVKNFIFTTAWGNQLPYFMSVAFQQAWSRKTSTNLLAANCHWPTYPNFPSTGSGMYSSGNPISTFVSGQEFTPGTGHLVVGQMPDGPGEKVVVKADSVGTKRASRLKIVILDNSGSASVSDKSPDVPTPLTCTLKYDFTPVEGETYGLGALIRKRNNEHTGVCTLFKCTDSSCSDTTFQPTTEASTIFSKISLTGGFPEGSEVFPSVVANHYHLLPTRYITVAGNTLTVNDPTPRPLLSVNLWSILPKPATKYNLFTGGGEAVNETTCNLFEG